MNSGALDILVLDDGTADEEVVRALLSADAALRIVRYTDGIGHQMPAADVVVVACGTYNAGAAELIREAVEDHPDRPVVLVTQGSPNGYIDDAFQAGVADLVVLPQPCDVEQARAMSPQVRFTLGKAVGGRGGASGGGGVEGKMVVMVGPKGGSGKTLSATNLAAALADGGQSVVIVDLDLQFGDVGLALGLAPDTTVYDLISSGGSLDADKLDSFLARHESGARALLAPRRPDEAGLITVEFLGNVFAMLRSRYEVVIVDTPPAFTREVIAAVDISSDVCLVGMLDALSLKNLKLGLETLERMGYDDNNIRFLLNRADTQVGISLDDVHAIVGRMPDVLVPSDREVTRSVNEGVPIVLKNRGSEAAKAFNSLAALYSGAQPTKRKRRRRLSFNRPA
ncbi:MAG: pilus assembly protein CpaE [Solirubrobacteraceae bacterium]|nr:pilus assembly protein CpaE [Solirubrobacteraceae bacterium]